MIKPRIFVFAILLLALALPECIFPPSVQAIHDFRDRKSTRLNSSH